MANLIGTSLPDVLLGSLDADSIQGLAADDILYGFDGADTLIGGLGDDFLYGGSGADLLIGGAGEDFYYGGSGIDTASFVSAGAGFTLNLQDSLLSTGDARGDLFYSIERFVLGGYNDRFIGTTRAETVSGGNGRDMLDGQGGADRLQGGPGADVLIGGEGADVLDGGTGSDTASYASSSQGISLNLVAGTATGDAMGDTFLSIEALVMTASDDIVVLGGAIHRVDGGAGADVLTGSALNDTLSGGFGADQIYGGLGDDLLNAGNLGSQESRPSSLNELHGGGGNDRLVGGTADDLLYGDDGADTLTGGDGNDFLSGGVGNDSLQGGNQDDVLIGGPGADLLDGGAGWDQAVYDSRVVLDLAAPGASTGYAAGDTLTGIEAVVMGTGSEASVVRGAARTITLDVQTSGVTFLAGTGAETVLGPAKVSYARMATGLTLAGDGGNALTGGGSAAGDRLDSVSALVLTAQADALDLGNLAGNGLEVSFASILTGGGADSVVLGSTIPVHVGLLDTGAGNDTVTGLAEGGSLSLGDGNDLLTILAPAGSTGAIQIDAGAGADRITVTAAHEVQIAGGLGADTITAQTYLGSIVGGDGDDQLNVTCLAVETGSFTVDAGAGADVITMTGATVVPVTSVRTITVLGGAGNDTIHGMDAGVASTAEAFTFEAGWGADVLDGFDAGQDQIVFLNTAAAGLTGFGDLTVSGDPSHTVLSFGADQIDILGLDSSLFDAGMVLFL